MRVRKPLPAFNVDYYGEPSWNCDFILFRFKCDRLAGFSKFPITLCNRGYRFFPDERTGGGKLTERRSHSENGEGS